MTDSTLAPVARLRVARRTALPESDTASTPSRQRDTSRRPTGLVYLYAVLPEGVRIPAILGIDPAEPLFPIEADGLVAAVSRVSADRFEEAPLNEMLSDLAQLAPHVVRHEETVRELTSLSVPVVPAAFGRVYRGENGVRAMLRDEGERLKRLLSELRGKEEWGLKITKDTARLWVAAETASPKLRELAEEEAAAQPGRAYLLRRQRERLHGAEAARIETDAIEGMLERIRSCASRIVVEDLLASTTPGDVQVALKGALLIPRPDVDGLKTVLRELEATYGPLGFGFDLNGPWAPYSFVRDGGGLN